MGVNDFYHMDNRRLLDNLIEVEIKKLEHKEFLDRENNIKQEKENIKQKVFSLGLLDKSNEEQIKNNLNLLYQQHTDFHEFIYQQIKTLGGIFHEISNNILIKTIEDKIKLCIGEDFNKKIINYFILNRLSKSNWYSIKKDFFYIIFILQYKDKDIVMKEINNIKIDYTEKNKPTNSRINELSEIKKNINDLTNQNKTIEELKISGKKVINIIGESIFTTRLNLLLIVLFLILKYKFDLEVGMVTFWILIVIGIVTQYILLQKFDISKLENKVVSNNRKIKEFEEKSITIQREINFFNQYIGSLDDFIV
jgi:hypothetical protein